MNTEENKELAVALRVEVEKLKDVYRHVTGSLPYAHDSIIATKIATPLLSAINAITKVLKPMEVQKIEKPNKDKILDAFTDCEDYSSHKLECGGDKHILHFNDLVMLVIEERIGGLLFTSYIANGTEPLANLQDTRIDRIIERSKKFISEYRDGNKNTHSN